MSKGAKVSEAASLRLQQAALAKLAAGDFRAAAALGRRALAAQNGVHPADVVNLLNLIGQAEEGMQDRASTTATRRRAVALLRHFKPEGAHAQVHVHTLILWSRTLRDEARWDSAETQLRTARAIATKVLGRTSVLVAGVLNEQGVLYKSCGRFTDARKCYRRALRIVMPRRQRDRALLATLMHNLGGIEHSLERYRAGEPYARKAVALRRSLRGGQHPEVAADLCALAGLLDGQRRFRESAPIYQRALAIFERRLGPTHFEVATTLNNFAAVLVELEDLKLAEAHYLRALAIKRRHFPARHPEVALTMHNLASLYLQMGKLQAAKKLNARARASLLESLGPSHPWTRASREQARRLFPRSPPPRSGLRSRAKATPRGSISSDT